MYWVILTQQNHVILRYIYIYHFLYESSIPNRSHGEGQDINKPYKYHTFDLVNIFLSYNKYYDRLDNLLIKNIQYYFNVELILIWITFS